MRRALSTRFCSAVVCLAAASATCIALMDHTHTVSQPDVQGFPAGHAVTMEGQERDLAAATALASRTSRGSDGTVDSRADKSLLMLTEKGKETSRGASPQP